MDHTPRGSRIPRCPRCALYRRVCICGELAPLAADTEVLLVLHHAEVRRPSNTGRLLLLQLARASALVYRRGEPLALPAGPSVLLMPGAPALSEADRGARLVVPDGTWREVRKLVTREPAMTGLPWRSLPEGPPSTYRLRHAEPGRLSTLEAVARALGVLEGPDVEAALLATLDLAVDRALWTRGLLEASRVRGGVPPRAAGAQGPRKTSPVPLPRPGVPGPVPGPGAAPEHPAPIPDVLAALETRNGLRGSGTRSPPK